MQKNLLEYLEHTARRLGDKIAFSDERESVTFWGLNQRSRAIGTALAQAVPGANRPVAVLADRSVMTLTAMLGVLAGGCYYVPVDEKMPQSRMQRVLGQLEPAAVLYQEKQRKLTEQLGDYPMLRVEDCLKGETDPAGAGCGSGLCDLYLRLHRRSKGHCGIPSCGDRFYRLVCGGRGRPGGGSSRQSGALLL